MEGVEKGAATQSVRKDLQNVSEWFKVQLEAGPHVPLIAAMILDKPTPASAAFFNKPAGDSREVPPHVDGLGQFDGATIWIALDAADRNNGCLCYVKGSHLKSHKQDELAAFDENS